MFLLVTLILPALANSGVGEVQGDFFVGSRTDAPTDGRLLFDATFDLDAEVIEGPDAPFTLQGLTVMGYMSGSETVVSFAPDAGWEAGAAYVVEVPIQGWDEDEVPARLAFTAGTDPAAAPSAPTVTSATAGAWSEEEEEHAWGCCQHVRVVTVEVEASSDDLWAFVELTGLFEGESQMSETPVLQRLDIGVGPGTHTLDYIQWDQDGLLQPGGFEVAQVSASGERSPAVGVDLGASGAERPPLCGTPGAVAFGPLALALLLVRRRARG
jgi:hypothetical protein